MATLTGACLHNEIDLPYYNFISRDELSLIIPSGKLVDKQMESLFDTYSGYINTKLRGEQLTDEQKRVLTYFYKSESANKLLRYTILLTKDNNHLDAIRSLVEAELIFSHTKSDNINPVYLIDPQLFQNNFFSQLSERFRGDFTSLRPDSKEILSLIYEANNFSEERYLSANQIGTILWIRHGNENLIEGFEDFKRKVRYSVSQLEKKKFIVRIHDNPKYMINTKYDEGNLFSSLD